MVHLTRRVIRGACIVAAVAAIVIGVAEIALQVRSAALQRWHVDANERERRQRAYRPCTEQHPHPHYGFFFPLEAHERLAAGNAVCSLDADGFREPGPGHAGSRRLAFVLGGSAAFGDMASSNDQTITSHLNRLQGEYFFVNAGVPSWNSTQELIRLALDLVERRPALIVVYDGANDAVLAGQIRQRSGRVYPPGTPEFFALVERLVDDDRALFGNGLRFDRLFPELRLRWNRFFPRQGGDVDEEDAVSAADIAAAAQHYRANHARMAELTRAAGARFVSVFQPVANLHQRRDHGTIPQHRLIEIFHQEATAMPGLPYEFFDFAAAFDGVVERITLADSNLADEAVFVDAVHLSDRGNAMVAELFWKAIATP